MREQKFFPNLQGDTRMTLSPSRDRSINTTQLIIPDIRAQKHALKKTYLFMIYVRFRKYSHLPHQVANNGINCYDIRLSKYKKKFGTQVCQKNVAIDNRYI